MIPDSSYQPVEGKTFSLFGQSNSTQEYYRLISSLANSTLALFDINTVMQAIRKYSPGKKRLRKIVASGKKDTVISYCLNTINQPLKPYTCKTAEHLKNLPIIKIWDRRLATTEEQYHLYMLEIELTNRLNRQRFLACDHKISLQPYCLQDFTTRCKAAKSDFDVQCKLCSKNCYQGKASQILKENGIEPYIWKGASIKNEAKESYKKGQTFGILGIACIPELVAGIRKCNRYCIPVVGIPLNANRCIRWFGEFHQNSIDLEELEKLVRT